MATHPTQQPGAGQVRIGVRTGKWERNDKRQTKQATPCLLTYHFVYLRSLLPNSMFTTNSNELLTTTATLGLMLVFDSLAPRPASMLLPIDGPWRAAPML